ncbi:hypothetical protein ILUMI_27134 [Ignelater luminosus]|uniref:Uncharacterized protein n=1 Tax=Ignelater luminosus TaxID=2038154 RepID=A0A8K0C8J5_IGNLU|nr:hypothetical protein ILUMI_27134 [Ignelater luminosus]
MSYPIGFQQRLSSELPPEVSQDVISSSQSSIESSQQSQGVSFIPEDNGKQKRQKKLVKKNGILSSPNPRGGWKLSSETENLVRTFYLREDNTRIMPGKKDFVSVKLDDGKRVHLQKQLLMCNIDELYQQFKSEYPDTKVGLTKFFTLRPKQCIFAGDSGTHVVCVCIYHQNVKLMLNGGDILSLTSESAIPLTSYKDCLKKMMCPNPTPICHLMTQKSPSNERCSNCPGLTEIREHLKTIFDENQITSVQFSTWIGTDRFTVSTQVLPSDDFVDSLCTALDILKPHAYIADQQAKYFNSLKDNIVKGDVIVQCDFAENYSFVVQDAAQSFHWNNDQATLLTSVYYYRQGQDIKHGSIVMISDDLKHDTATFFTFQNILHRHLQENNIIAKKYIFITDEAPQHFKNRFNFINLFYFNHDFGTEAEIHFHATSHGKGPCDDLGGNIKRLATRASLQSAPNKAITTPKCLYEWAKASLPHTTIYYSDKDEIDQYRIHLKSRFDSAITITGTKKIPRFHSDC